MNIKRLVLGAAAGALAVTGAQAADLPVVVEPVDYVQICSAYGDGFFFVPGTEGCLRIRGRVRVDFTNRFDLDNNGVVLANRGYDDIADTGYQWKARGQISLDHFTETEFGQLRTFVNLQMNRDSGVGIDGTPTDNVLLDQGFIQLGGLLVGRNASNFVSVVGGPEVILDTAGDNPNILQAAYIAQFGNGLSAAVAIEDTTRRRPGIGNITTFFAGGNGVGPRQSLSGHYAGAKVPDLVATLAVDQGWGSASLSGVLRMLDVARRINGPAGSTFIDSTQELGWAVAGNVSVNVPFGAATSFAIGAGYGQGATRYLSGGATNASFGGRGNLLFTDGIYRGTGVRQNGNVNGNDFEKTEALVIGASLTSAFTPTVAGTLAGGWVNLQNDNTIREVNDFNVNAQLAYTPVSGFLIAAGVEYRYADVTNSQDGQGLGTYIRLQRDF
ncbi:porin [Acuticoccus sp. MNP-M23]|uniref:porin n=1 Tax=Acuticoccus sp. MNP-M23 TaxID=3072793 RepID=UPI0028150CC8|nr:porin [Acuticoccus sp. MNP-M23]WMS40803.1 porin [Acuticoccus sp. MNP-M23]